MPPITPRPALRAAVEVMEQPDAVEEHIRTAWARLRQPS